MKVTIHYDDKSERQLDVADAFATQGWFYVSYEDGSRAWFPPQGISEITEE